MSSKSIVLALAALTALPLFAVIGTVHTANDVKTGDIRYQPRSQTYFITYKQGKADVNAEYKVSEVESLDIPKPAEFDKAVGEVNAGRGSAAIPVLTKIVADYRMLVWDKPAGRYLALAYLAAGQHQQAYDACQRVIAGDKSAAWSGDLAAAYWQALLKLGKTRELEEALKKATASGDRSAAAAALVMRGDIILAEGDSPAVLRRALADGYLRVVLMFTDEACARERQEALVKAAKCFDGLHQASRAEYFRQQATAR